MKVGGGGSVWRRSSTRSSFRISPSAGRCVLATIAFGIQIYADFNGYSLIAKGVALLFGFELTWNFRYPYWSTSISEFWRRWHISLSTWLRDYLYISARRKPSRRDRSRTGICC